MNLITLDIETFFSADYTLKKLTTEAYVRDPRFKVHCCGIKHDLSFAIDKIVLRDIYCFDREYRQRIKTNAVVAHHAQFDGLILSHHYDIRPSFWFDTMAMSHILFPHERHSLAALAKRFRLAEKTVPYHLFKGVRDLPQDIYNQVADGCAHDIELTHAIFKKMLPYVPADELRIIDLTIRMFTEPALRLDRDMLNEYLKNTREEKDDMLSACGVTKEDMGSAEKFAALLRGFGVEPAMKISKKTKKPIYAFAQTDSFMRELLNHDDDAVIALAEARLGVKSNMVQTRAQRMLDMDTRGAMCVYLAYAKATTHRWAGGDKMNWQNFKRGSVLRTALVAPEGWQVVVIDEAQIECRMLNFLAGQWDILEKFRNREDIYSQLASEFYGFAVNKKDHEKERGTGKQIELSCGFRAGAETIKITARNGTYGPPVHLTDAQALAARDLYRRTHPKVVELWKYCDKVILPALLNGVHSEFAWGPMRVHGKHIILPNGAALDYSHLHQNFDEYGRPRFYTVGMKGATNMHGGILTQNVIEALSRLILCNAMLAVGPRYKIVTCTHDELVYLARDAEADEALKFGLDTMKTPLAWCQEIPLDAEGGFSRNYSK